MEQAIHRYRTITYRPHWPQYVISQGGMLLLTLGFLMGAGWEGMPIKAPFYVGAALTGMMMLYGCLYLRMLRFTLTDEQLIVHKGVFSRHSDYIELYRVVDFGESRNVMEQLFGLKTVNIYSGDRTTPRLDLFGIRENTDVVSTVRERVNYNKKLRNIHEFTNTK